jgi:hypothetical protein
VRDVRDLARSRVHTWTRNRLSNDGSDTSQVILFNRLQFSRDADGALLSKRTSGIQSRIVAALLFGGPVPSVPAAGQVPDAADEDYNGDVVGGCPAGGEDAEVGSLADGAEDGLAVTEPKPSGVTLYVV